MRENDVDIVASPRCARVLIRAGEKIREIGTVDQE
jgi:hypothetical protein